MNDAVILLLMRMRPKLKDQNIQARRVIFVEDFLSKLTPIIECSTLQSPALLIDDLENIKDRSIADSIFVAPEFDPLSNMYVDIVDCIRSALLRCDTTDTKSIIAATNTYTTAYNQLRLEQVL